MWLGRRLVPLGTCCLGVVAALTLALGSASASAASFNLTRSARRAGEPTLGLVNAEPEVANLTNDRSVNDAIRVLGRVTATRGRWRAPHDQRRARVDRRSAQVGVGGDPRRSCAAELAGRCALDIRVTTPSRRRNGRLRVRQQRAAARPTSSTLDGRSRSTAQVPLDAAGTDTLEPAARLAAARRPWSSITVNQHTSNRELGSRETLLQVQLLGGLARPDVDGGIDIVLGDESKAGADGNPSHAPARRWLWRRRRRQRRRR